MSIENNNGIIHVDDLISDLEKIKSQYGNIKLDFSTIHKQYFSCYVLDDKQANDEDEDFRVVEFRLR